MWGIAIRAQALLVRYQGHNSRNLREPCSTLQSLCFLSKTDTVLVCCDLVLVCWFSVCFLACLLACLHATILAELFKELIVCPHSGSFKASPCSLIVFLPCVFSRSFMSYRALWASCKLLCSPQFPWLLCFNLSYQSVCASTSHRGRPMSAVQLDMLAVCGGIIWITTWDGGWHHSPGRDPEHYHADTNLSNSSLDRGYM